MKFLNRGFTLIEIMIAISIVAVTFGVIISSASQVRKTGRDAQRQADLQSIQAALQQFYADQNYYPDSMNLAASAPNPGAPITNCPTVPAGFGCTVTKTYLNRTPIAPSGTDYYYRSGVDSTTARRFDNCSIGPPDSSKQCHFYLLCADLEGTSPQAPSQYADCDNYNANYNYQLNP